MILSIEDEDNDDDGVLLVADFVDEIDVDLCCCCCCDDDGASVAAAAAAAAPAAPVDEDVDGDRSGCGLTELRLGG